MESNSDIQTVLIETVVKKLREQNDLLVRIQEQTSKSDHLQPKLEAIRNELHQIKKGDLFSQILTQEIKAIKAPINGVLRLLDAPIEHTNIHHHHFPKLLWITIALLLLCVCLITSWNHCSNKLDNYKFNDSKYRFLQLQEGKSLQTKLKWVDSLYKVRPNMLDSVNNLEQDRNAKLEMIRQAIEMENKAKEMRKDAEK
ncbi:hypothetical protein [Rhizosphaericola mali]|uniref:Uncharacterized protein n=1 Tax=Rhizosphaericola mali TaxID=2545455 RepID=A0A5P2G0J7_9BACT|nr:hypothetical protein [Rhizosphaericola mali]QES87362.1 hypothetical protein E0W69_001370 [Rhizosphaericola mali]